MDYKIFHINLFPSTLKITPAFSPKLEDLKRNKILLALTQVKYLVCSNGCYEVQTIPCT